MFIYFSNTLILTS